MRGPCVLGTFALAAILALRAGAEDEGPRRIRITGDDLRIAEDVIVEPGTYAVTDAKGDGVLRVAKEGIEVVLEGVTLDGAAPGAAPDAFRGVGISVVGVRGVRIRGGKVRGFQVGLRAEASPDLLVADLDASGNFRQRLKSTPEREDPSDWLWPHENDRGEWEAKYGAGISLTACEGAEVSSCTVRRGQNGLLLTRCEGARVSGNDFSFNSGWGIALYRSSRCDISDNRCDWCVRGYSHGVYARGQDSAGILVFEQSSDNRFSGNSATHSGDGFFLYAGHETTQRTGEGGSNRNLVIGNDFSYAVANGIEATFSEENVFTENDCSGSDHGVWAGYSRRTQIHRTKAIGCLTAGVSIEHGQENLIEENWLEARGDGVHLWWDEDKDLLAGPFCREKDCTSSRNTVVRNRIRAGREAIRRVKDEDSQVEENVLVGPEERWEGMPGSAPPAQEDPEAAKARGDSTPPNTRAPGLLWPEGLPRGREQIRVDEWGPVDPRESRVFPARVDAAGNVARFFVLGDQPARVVATSPGVTATLEGGKGPGLSVTNTAPDAPSLLPFQVEVEIGRKRHRVEGTLLIATWDVRWFRWTKDPREDAPGFAALLAGEPAARQQTASLDFPWNQGGPAPDLVDRFATRAAATLRLPAGRYRLATLSDDGVRVRVDGQVVLENWTWHGPTEDAVEVDLAQGPHEIVVEHFEIDGWAVLRLSLERLAGTR